MRRRSIAAASLLAVTLTIALSACSRPDPPPLRMIDLAESADTYVGQRVTVDIVEPLSREESSDLVRVDIPELGEPIMLTGLDPAPTPGAGPVRVRGELFRRGARLFAADDCVIRCYELHILTTEPLPQQTPARVSSLRELLANRERWDRQLVVYEGSWAFGFERSSLDSKIWLGAHRATELLGGLRTTGPRGPGESTKQHVRVTGRLYAHGNATYGHLGGYPLALDASKIERLD